MAIKGPAPSVNSLWEWNSPDQPDPTDDTRVLPQDRAVAEQYKTAVDNFTADPEKHLSTLDNIWGAINDDQFRDDLITGGVNAAKGMVAGTAGLAGDLQQLASMGVDWLFDTNIEDNKWLNFMPTSDEIGKKMGADTESWAFLAGAIAAPDPYSKFRLYGAGAKAVAGAGAKVVSELKKVGETLTPENAKAFGELVTGYTQGEVSLAQVAKQAKEIDPTINLDSIMTMQVGNYAKNSKGHTTTLSWKPTPASKPVVGSPFEVALEMKTRGLDDMAVEKVTRVKYNDWGQPEWAINDMPAKFKHTAFTEHKFSAGGGQYVSEYETTLGSILHHPELFESYRGAKTFGGSMTSELNLENLKVRVVPHGGVTRREVGGQYDGTSGVIRLFLPEETANAFMGTVGSWVRNGDKIGGNLRNGKTGILLENEMLPTLLHEVQHAVQRVEGFAVGGSRDMWIDTANLIQDMYMKGRGSSKALMRLTTRAGERTPPQEYIRQLKDEGVFDQEFIDELVQFGGVGYADPGQSTHKILSKLDKDLDKNWGTLSEAAKVSKMSDMMEHQDSIGYSMGKYMDVLSYVERYTRNGSPEKMLAYLKGIQKGASSKGGKTTLMLATAKPLEVTAEQLETAVKLTERLFSMGGDGGKAIQEHLGLWRRLTGYPLEGNQLQIVKQTLDNYGEMELATSHALYRALAGEGMAKGRQAALDIETSFSKKLLTDAGEQVAYTGRAELQQKALKVMERVPVEDRPKVIKEALKYALSDNQVAGVKGFIPNAKKMPTFHTLPDSTAYASMQDIYKIMTHPDVMAEAITDHRRLFDQLRTVIDDGLALNVGKADLGALGPMATPERFLEYLSKADGGYLKERVAKIHKKILQSAILKPVREQAEKYAPDYVAKIDDGLESETEAFSKYIEEQLQVASKEKDAWLQSLVDETV